MKLWQKICITALLFFLVVFTGMSILMIENNRKIAFGRILRQAADEQESITTGMIKDIWKDREQKTKEGISGRIKEYLENRVNSPGTYLEIQVDGVSIYSNLDIDRSVLGVMKYYGGRMPEYTVMEQNGRQYLILNSFLTVEDLELRNLYLADISGIYEDRRKQYTFFIKLASGISVLLAAGLYLITRHFTKALDILTDSVRNIAGGDYQKRVFVSTKDEIGVLADSYNHMAAEIEETIEELKQKAEEQQRFIDNFTHELKTPLTAVVGYSDLLRSTNGDEEYGQELGERIFREGKRIEKLAEEMMDLIFLKRHHFELKPCNITELLNQLKDEFTPAAKKAGIKLELLLPEQSLHVLGKWELLLILFSNLLDNAKKASEKEGRVWMRAGMEKETVIVEIEDEGKGIPKEEQSKIFENFYMVDKVRNQKNNGVGLGLSICMDIVKIHNARLELISREQKGTLVKVCFIGTK